MHPKNRPPKYLCLHMVQKYLSIFCGYFYFNHKKHVHIGKGQRLMMKEERPKYVQMDVLSLLNAVIWSLGSAKSNVSFNSQIYLFER